MCEVSQIKKKQNYGFLKMDFRRRSARTSRRENAISEIIAENGLKCNSWWYLCETVFYGHVQRIDEEILDKKF